MVIAVSAVASLAAIYYVAVQTRTGQVLDTRAMDLTARALVGARWTTTVLALVTPTNVVLSIATLGLLLWVMKSATAAVESSCAAIGTILAAIASKTLLARPTLFGEGANSLPSGHVAAVAGVVAAVALSSSPTVRPLVLGTGAAAVGLTGVATVALKWHRPSDVLASVLVATAVAAATRRTVTGCGERRSSQR
jgi:membrane-associated phospholipid phosphatase